MKSRGSEGLSSVRQLSKGKCITHQVVSQELHDQGGVLVALLTEGIKFCGIAGQIVFFFLKSCGYQKDIHTSDSIIKSLLGKVACLVG